MRTHLLSRERDIRSAGARGQFTTVVPSRDLVVVRRGLDQVRFQEPANWDQVELVADILEAISPR